jgi:magnesium-transporting ATPase (P-type)
MGVVVLVCLAIRDPNGRSAAPLSTLQMIFIYISITPPAGLLSVQPASKTVMQEPPRPPTENIFSKEIIIDTLTYSLGLTIVCMIGYLVPLFVLGDGVGGFDCDSQYYQNAPGACDSFFRGRASLLVTFCFSSIVVMVHCRSYRNVEWDLEGMKKTFKSKTVLGTIIFNLVGLCVFMYIPQVAIEGFRMLGITWEWGLDAGLVLFMIVFGEVFKMCKRRFMKPIVTSLVEDEESFNS